MSSAREKESNITGKPSRETDFVFGYSRLPKPQKTHKKCMLSTRVRVLKSNNNIKRYYLIRKKTFFPDRDDNLSSFESNKRDTSIIQEFLRSTEAIKRQERKKSGKVLLYNNIALFNVCSVL